MNKIKPLEGKISLINAMYLGFMMLGVGCFSFAIFSILSQSSYSVPAAVPTSVAATSRNIKPVYVKSNVPPVPVIASKTKTKTIYPVNPVEGDNIGSLYIPALNRKLPIIQGTGEKELKKGVGHFTQSVLPGVEDNCVISGHRDTVFSQLGNLKKGDQLIVETAAGIFTYEVNGTRIVHKDDRTVIVPTNHAILTMTTCYPFNFIGDAPDRYIVSAALIKNK